MNDITPPGQSPDFAIIHDALDIIGNECIKANCDTCRMKFWCEKKGYLLHLSAEGAQYANEIALAVREEALKMFREKNTSQLPMDLLLDNISKKLFPKARTDESWPKKLVRKGIERYDGGLEWHVIPMDDGVEWVIH